MNVTLVGTHYTPFLGGIETHMEQLAMCLSAQGVHVRVVCITEGQGRFVSRTYEEDINGISVRRVASRGFRETARLSERLIERGSADLVHFHGFSRPLLLQMRIAGRALPWIVTPHGGLIGLSVDQVRLRRAAKALFDRVFATRLLRDASRVICLTPSEQRFFIDIVRLKHSATVVLPNPVPVECAQPLAIAQGSSGRLLVLGRLSTQKRISDLIHVLTARPDLPDCDVAGPDDNDSARLRRLAAELPPGRIRFLGPVRGDSKVQLIRSAKALIVCSHWEGHPITVLEAVAQGTPVIASDAVAAVAPFDSMLSFPVGNLGRLAERIAMLGDPSVVLNLRSQAARARASLLSPHDHARRMVLFYQAALGS